jgi:hypothetical protein
MLESIPELRSTLKPVLVISIFVSFRTLINSALKTRFLEAGPMWECLMDTRGRRNRWCNQRRCWQVEVVLVLGMSS